MARFRLGVLLTLVSSTVGGLLLTAAPTKPPPDLPGEGALVGVAGQKLGVFQQDDPLPEGAIARLGSGRFRHGSGVSHLAFCPTSFQGRMPPGSATGTRLEMRSGRRICRPVSGDGKMAPVVCMLPQEQGVSPDLMSGEQTTG